MNPALEKENLLPSGVTETPQETLARSKKMLEPSISADDLATPVSPVNVPTPARPDPSQGQGTQRLIQNVATNTQGFIESQSEEAQRLKELSGLIGEQEFDASGQRQSLNEQFGLPADMQRLQDLQTQLAQANTESQITQSRIQNAAGQTLGQAGREVTQEQRENAIRTAGVAAEASVLQGNIQTAQTIINSAMQDYYQDRQLRNQNMINQMNFLKGVVDNQTAQLVRREQRQYEEDQTQLQRVQSNIDKAMATGSTTEQEIAMFTNPNTTDDERLALAQLIQARSASEDRAMSQQAARLDMAVKAQQLAKLRAPSVATRQTDIVEVGGQKQLVDTQTGEVLATFGANVSNNEIEQAKKTQFTNTITGLISHPGMDRRVGPTSFARSAILNPLSTIRGEDDEFVGAIDNVIKTLTLNTFAEAKEKGMTFGAMSEAEWDILGQSATQLAQWRKDDDGYIYFDISEKAMNEELAKLGQFAAADAIRSGADPVQMGVLQTDDGKYWMQDSLGNMTSLPVSTPAEAP